MPNQLKYLIFIFLSVQLNGQDDNSNILGPLSVKGGLRINTGFYEAFNGDLRTSPLSYGVSGNVTLGIGKFDLPISLMYNDHSLSLSKPFFYLGASPEFGKVKVHLGNRNLFFSKYSLGGATFFGVAAEAQLGKLRLGAMYGSFEHPLAHRDSIVYGTIELPTFDRKGYSVKIGVGSERNYFDLVLLKVKDDYLDPLAPEETFQRPKDNLVIGAVFNQQITKQLSLRIDGAVSALTNDLEYDIIEIEDEFVQNIRSLFEVNPTTNISYAAEAELGYRVKRLNSFFQYRRISPHFQSFGINYLNPDREEFLLRFSTAFLRSRLRLRTSIGIQRNNLFDQKASASNRFIGSLSLLYKDKGPWKVMAQYNNYDISNTPTIVEDNDSLKLARVMNQFKLRPSYKIKSGNFDHTIGLTLMYKLINGEFAFKGRDTKNSYVNLMYGILFKEFDLTAKINANFNRNNTLSFTRDRIGTTISASKPIVDNKLLLNWSGSYFKNLINNKNDGYSMRTGVSMTYKPLNKHGINFSVFYNKRSSIVFQSISDIQGRIAYNIRF